MHIQYAHEVTWDEHKRLRNLEAHGVDFAGLLGFLDGDLLTAEDKREAYGELRFRSTGVVNEAILSVTWAIRGSDGATAHIISARRSTRHETQAWIQRYSKR
jgi:uncharacterized DUF497 family protein